MPQSLWPSGCRGAVSLTFDDGNPTQLKHAIPIMEERGLRGTFYVSIKTDDHMKRLEPWVEVSARGHEIGNHTKSHTCSRNFSNDPDAKGLERSTLDEIEQDILAAEAALRERFPDVTERTFAYPCYQHWVGEGLQRQSYVPLIAKHFVAGRGMIHYLAYEIHDVKIQGETAEVTCTVETKIDRKYVPGLRGSPYMEHVNRDRWVRIDGTWYRKYEDSREGDTAPGVRRHRG